jgi:6-phosphogluconate dehydrogenase
MKKTISNSQVGIVGLATMGSNLAKNFASKNIKTSVYNRTYEKTEALIKEQNENILGFKNLSNFVLSIEKPRKIILMIKSGSPIDLFIEEIYPFLEDDDILIDAGNSNWKDTKRRIEQLKEGKLYTLEAITKSDSNLVLNKKINFVGCGISGGEEGAKLGPSIMPGGDKEVVDNLLPLLEKISAKDFEGKPCTTNIGLESSGHFVKTVHNGIEYAMMQGIAEIYDILKNSDYTNLEIKKVFEEINTKENKSFLLDITIKIFESKDYDKEFLIDKIIDKAKAKGTGKWTVESAMDLGISAPTIAASLFARTASARSQNFETIRNNPIKEKVEINNKDLWFALNKVFECSYFQGLDIIAEANKEYGWEIDLKEVVRIWQGGCIIRSEILKNLYTKWTKVLNLKENFDSLNRVIDLNRNLPKPALNSCKDYILSLSTNELPTNLIQAQRDYFGAHTYEKKDENGIFSGGWRK